MSEYDHAYGLYVQVFLTIGSRVTLQTNLWSGRVLCTLNDNKKK